MNSYIQKIQEARTFNEADRNVLSKLGANGSVKKNVESYFMMRDSPNPQTREYGMTCLNEAATTLKDSEQPAQPESPGLKVKGNHFVKEELLSNHNPTTSNTGSDQSSDNTPPYPQEGRKFGDEDMEDAPDTENQMTEMEDDSAMDILENTDLHPDIRKKMGANMPKVPPMDTGDAVKQMQYTVKPIINHIKKQDKIIEMQGRAIRKLSEQVRETRSMSLDLESVKENSIASFRETTSGQVDIPINFNQQKPQNTEFELIETRSRISELNDALAAKLT